MYFFSAVIVLTYLICEAINQIKVMRTFRSTRYYIFKFLAVNSNKQTLEQYLLKQFYPRYFGVLGLFFALLCAGHIFMKGADHYICLTIIFSVLLLRFYNRSIFSDLWTELSRTR
jgi:hypothetical protein